MPKDKLKAQYTKEEFEAYLLHEQGHLNLIGRLMTTVYALLMVFVFFFLYLTVLFWTGGFTVKCLEQSSPLSSFSCLDGC